MSDTKKKTAALSEEDLSEVAGGIRIRLEKATPDLNAEVVADPNSEKQVTNIAPVYSPEPNRIVTTKTKRPGRNNSKRNVP